MIARVCAAWGSLSMPVRGSLAALGVGVLILGAGVASPPVALLCVALVAAAMMVANGAGVSVRPGVWVFCGLAAAAVGAGLNGVAGAMGAGFLWLMADTAKALRTRGDQLARTDGGRAEPGLRGIHSPLMVVFMTLLVAASAPHMLLGVPLDLPHPPVWAVALCGLLAVGALFDWAIRALTRWRLGEGGVALAVHHACAHAVLLGAFVASPDVSAGVLALIGYRFALAIQPAALGVWRSAPQASFTAVP